MAFNTSVIKHIQNKSHACRHCTPVMLQWAMVELNGSICLHCAWGIMIVVMDSRSVKLLKEC